MYFKFFKLHSWAKRSADNCRRLIQRLLRQPHGCLRFARFSKQAEACFEKSCVWFVCLIYCVYSASKPSIVTAS